MTTQQPLPPPTSVKLRPPHHLVAKSPPKVPLPSPSQMLGTWFVTHSTLPLWKDKRNVRITYSLHRSNTGKIDDTVHYQSLTSSSPHIIAGIDTASNASQPCTFTWRGRGLLSLTTAHWEILGWGKTTSSSPDEEADEWMCTYFAKTMFTPAGIDFYSRRRGGLSERTVKRLKEELGVVNDLGRREGRAEMGRLIQGLFAVRYDEEGEAGSEAESN